MIKDETINHIAKLARLTFSEKEKVDIKQDLEKIVEFCKQLDQVDTKDVEPLLYVSENPNRLREDTIKPSLSKSEALKNAPLADSDYFKIPKVIKK